MTDKQKRFVELDREKEKIKKWYEEYNKATEELFDELGGTGHFQDDQGIVYMAEKPKGTFVEYKEKGIIRTKRINETKGTLSVTKAKELGYDIK